MKKNTLALITILVIVATVLILGVLFAAGKLPLKSGDKKGTANSEINVDNDAAKSDNIEIDTLEDNTNTSEETNNNETKGTETNTTVIGDVSLVWPSDNHMIVLYYGEYETTFGENEFHSGIDIAGSEGDPVYAASSGTVVSVVDYGNVSYGKSILINHNNGYYTLYAHLSDYAEGLTEGMTVTSGQLIGYVGLTGWATGAHLHFEVRTCQEYSCTVNPLPFLNQ